MIDKVIKAIDSYGMLKGVKQVTVALSGGADSVALLGALLLLKDKYGITVKAAHLNHNLRGEESERDEAFVKELCRTRSVSLVCESADVETFAKESGDSVELAARKIRYDFFERCGGVVATAHTADDNLETVLINLARGTALTGLCGIPPVRDNFIRPLIFCTRRDIEEFCNEQGLSFVTDSTNLTDDYTRNKIRHNAVPVLKAVNGDAAGAVSATCEILRRENEYLESKAEKVLANAKNGQCLRIDVLKNADEVIMSRALRRFAKSITGILPDGYHTALLCRLAEKGEGKCQLAGNYFAQVVKKQLQILPAVQKSVDFSVKTEIISKEEFCRRLKINSLLSKNSVDCDKLVSNVNLRTRLPGDEIKFKNRPAKSLKKLYNELAVPENRRSNLPVAADDKGVIWIYTAGVAARAAVDNNTEKILIFNVTEEGAGELE